MENLNGFIATAAHRWYHAGVMKQYELTNLTVAVGAPVIVGRAAGHHWFPTLHPFDMDNILCEVVTADDKAQGKWPATLYLSQNGGGSWTRACDIDSYGAISTLLEDNRLLLMPYELWPVAPGDKSNATAEGTIVTLCADGVVSVEPAPVRFLDFPFDLADYHEGELSLVTNGNILPLADGRLFATLYGTRAGEEKYHSFAVVSDDGGFTWTFLSIVASWRDAPEGREGPCESATCRLTDGRLFCVYRIGSGRDQNYYGNCSADVGVTWSKPQPLQDVWSVEPQIVRLTNGTLLLSGGRPGLFLWACADGEGKHWDRLNLAEHHNAFTADTSLHYSPPFVEAAKMFDPYQSTSYSGMKVVGDNEALICYDRLANGWHGAPGPWGDEDVVFTVRVKVDCVRW